MSAIACPCPATTGCPASLPTRVTLAASPRPDPVLICPGGYRGHRYPCPAAPASALARAVGPPARRSAVASAWSQAASSIRATGPRASGSRGRSRSKGVRPSRPASSMPGSTSRTGIRRTAPPRIRAAVPSAGTCTTAGGPPAEETTVRGTAAARPAEPCRPAATRCRRAGVVFFRQILGGLLPGCVQRGKACDVGCVGEMGQALPSGLHGSCAAGAAESTTAGRCAGRTGGTLRAGGSSW